MGQPIEVTARAGSSPQIMIFSVNRSLTGMRIEGYHDPAHAEGDRWCDELARRIGALGASRVTVYASDIVVEAADWSGLQAPVEDAIRDLYIYYVGGVIPEGDYTGEEPAAEPAPAEAESAEAESGEQVPAEA